MQLIFVRCKSHGINVICAFLSNIEFWIEFCFSYFSLSIQFYLLDFLMFRYVHIGWKICDLHLNWIMWNASVSRSLMCLSNLPFSYRNNCRWARATASKLCMPMSMAKMWRAIGLALCFHFELIIPLFKMERGIHSKKIQTATENGRIKNRM